MHAIIVYIHPMHFDALTAAVYFSRIYTRWMYSLTRMEKDIKKKKEGI